MALNAKQKAVKLTVLHPTVVAVLNTVSPVTKSVAAVAAAAGVTLEASEHGLSLLVDEGLMAQSLGDRVTRVYTAT